ncbi:hypothetical protein NAI64_02265 [Oxalobacter sp. OxGP1]|uniref:hypothetical protein n=1 Tax=Oxalobacter paeniformigenes TaxID=2946594 RepID=UPI0022AF8706|nr:hypothetical protein [Oxalobacter paeniformigenes]MCZ4052547.1 hypothetical protein [Oxalobacter paeniformigenes]
MNSEKDIELHDADDTGICLTFIEKEADDPTTDVDFTGTSVNHIEPDDDPTTDVDFTGTSVNHIETDDDAGYTMRGRNHIDAQCEGIDMDPMFAFGSVSYQDPLGDVELGDSDDTGICLHYIDTDTELDEFEPDLNLTGTSTMRMDDDDTDPTTDVDVTGRAVGKLIQ